jgi:hypothetical protein
LGWALAIGVAACKKTEFHVSVRDFFVEGGEAMNWSKISPQRDCELYLACHTLI